MSHYHYILINKVFTYYFVCCGLVLSIEIIIFEIKSDSTWFEFKCLLYCLQIHVSFCHDAYVTKSWCTVKSTMIKATHDGNALRNIHQLICASNLWKWPHFKDLIKGFLIGISLPNFVNKWNCISPIYRHENVVPQIVVPMKITKWNVAPSAGVFPNSLSSTRSQISSSSRVRYQYYVEKYKNCTVVTCCDGGVCCGVIPHSQTLIPLAAA